MTDMQKKSFGTMLSPIRAGQHMLRNRVIMGSMHTRLETEPDSIARQIAFYAERARGEAAILVTGGFAPNAEGMFDPEGPASDLRGGPGRRQSDLRAASARRALCKN